MKKRFMSIEALISIVFLIVGCKTEQAIVPDPAPKPTVTAEPTTVPNFTLFEQEPLLGSEEEEEEALEEGPIVKEALAILPFTGGKGDEGDTIAELFSFQRELTAFFNPVPRTSISRAITNEQGFQMTSGMTDPDTIAALGKQLGARYVVSGTIAKLGDQNLLVIAILHTEDLRQIAGDIQTYGDLGEIRGKLQGMAQNIVAAIKIDASNLPLLAVPPVQWSGESDNREADTLAQILAVHLVQSGKYAVYPRTKSLEQVQEEYNNQFNGDVADEYLPNIGRGINPRLVLSVSARQLGNTNLFNAAIINLESGIQIVGDAAGYQRLDDGVAAMEELALRLTGQEALAAQMEEERLSRQVAQAGQRQTPSTAQAGQGQSSAQTPSTAQTGQGQSSTQTPPAAQTGQGQSSAQTPSTAQAGQGQSSAQTPPAAQTGQGQSSAQTPSTAQAGQGQSSAQTPSTAQAGQGQSSAQPAPVVQASARNAAAFAEAVAAINNERTSGTYTITLNATLSADPVTFTGNATKTIILQTDGSPRTIRNNGANALFTVPRGITLVLAENISLNGNTKEAVIVSVDGGTLIMNTGSALYGAKKSAVSLNNRAVFTMRGGEIGDNSGGSSGNGGGVFVSNSTFTMEDGTISGNTVGIKYGGGVFVTNSGVFAMKGGSIRNNKASTYGSGVYVEAKATFTMEGGAISDNEDRGVCVDGAAFTMEGGTINRNTGGGVFLADNATFIMAEGSITGNTAGDGGGVYVYGSTFTMEGGSISWNTTSSNGGGVFVNGGTFTMEGGTINRNTASGNGGGVYVFGGTFSKRSRATIDDTNSASKDGKVVYAGAGKQRNSTAGVGVTLNSSINGSGGGWE